MSPGTYLGGQRGHNAPGAESLVYRICPYNVTGILFNTIQHLSLKDNTVQHSPLQVLKFRFNQNFIMEPVL